MQATVEQIGDITLVKPEVSRLDAAGAIAFKDCLREISEGGANHVVLNMENITFMDSSGLGAIVAVFKLMGRDKTFELTSLTASVLKVFKLTRMDSVFTIFASVDMAISAADEKKAG